MITASTPKGTRDFLPVDVYKRDYIFNTIRTIFQKYGYQPIETPAMENLITLTGKYGDEGDKLLFKILNSGDFLGNVPSEKLSKITSKELAPDISEKGLRYDLTVPFARFVVQHRNDLIFPFKRYQIQPVWRADRPQKGRYREFYQCDVDVIGSNSLLNDLELIQIIDEVFTKFNIDITIKINHRKILLGLCELYGITDKFNDFVVALDKLDKIGIDGVEQELKNRDINIDFQELRNDLTGILAHDLSEIQNLKLKFEKIGSVNGLKGINDITTLFSNFDHIDINRQKIIFDISLARGLNYYTGCIFEVVAKNSDIGSICGGGRYDDLTGIFGLNDISGTGVSFGADRIFDLLSQTGNFPDDLKSTVKILFVNFGEAEARFCLKILDKLRKSGISAELYPDTTKLKKQLDYANNRKIPFVIMIGSREIEQNLFPVKNMITGEQVSMDLDQIRNHFKS